MGLTAESTAVEGYGSGGRGFNCGVDSVGGGSVINTVVAAMARLHWRSHDGGTMMTVASTASVVELVATDGYGNDARGSTTMGIQQQRWRQQRRHVRKLAF